MISAILLSLFLPLIFNGFKGSSFFTLTVLLISIFTLIVFVLSLPHLSVAFIKTSSSIGLYLAILKVPLFTGIKKPSTSKKTVESSFIFPAKNIWLKM